MLVGLTSRAHQPIIKTVRNERPAALICLSLNSHHFHGLVTSFVSSEPTTYLSEICCNTRRCFECGKKSCNVLDWTHSAVLVRYRQARWFIEYVEMYLVRILKQRWGHYHYEWEELMRLLRQDGVASPPGSRLPTEARAAEVVD